MKNPKPVKNARCVETGAYLENVGDDVRNLVSFHKSTCLPKGSSFVTSVSAILTTIICLCNPRNLWIKTVGVGIRPIWLLLSLLLVGFGISSRAQNTLNVTNYGAVGDAVQFLVNTVSNSAVITTTNQLSSTDVGKSIEVFVAGTPTSSLYNQDLVTTIASVDETGTNITLATACGKSWTNAFATYGHNNTPNFQAAISAVGSDANDTIYVPAGTYLLLATNHSGIYGNSAILIQRGGINFVGEGTNNTILLSQGAWTLISGSCWRGFLVELAAPMANHNPISFSYLTMDGGVTNGYDSSHSQAFPASKLTGKGWDGTHDAVLSWIVNVSSINYPNLYFTNVLVQHWRGEMFKSIDQPANCTIGIYNSRFTDGNATALNIYPAWDVRSNLFDHLFQVAEYYQAYYSYPSYFSGNVISNIIGNGFAFNGGKGNNPPFIMEDNSFYFTSSFNVIETTPGDNIFITNNYLYGGVSIALGIAGYQGTFCNSNIVIANNTFENPYYMITIAGALDGNGANRVVGVQMYGNVLTNSTSVTAIKYYGWATNVICYNNDFSSASTVSFLSGLYGSQFALVSTNNLYYYYLSDSIGITNYISYVNGSRFQIINAFHSGTVYALVDTNASQMPMGAQMLIYNNNSSSATVPLYLNSSLTGDPVMIASGQTVVFNWNNLISQWQTNSQTSSTPPPPDPPTNVRQDY